MRGRSCGLGFVVDFLLFHEGHRAVVKTSTARDRNVHSPPMNFHFAMAYEHTNPASDEREKKSEGLCHLHLAGSVGDIRPDHGHEAHDLV